MWKPINYYPITYKLLKNDVWKPINYYFEEFFKIYIKEYLPYILIMYGRRERNTIRVCIIDIYLSLYIFLYLSLYISLYVFLYIYLSISLHILPHTKRRMRLTYYAATPLRPRERSGSMSNTLEVS